VKHFVLLVKVKRSRRRRLPFDPVTGRPGRRR
jgi:hypothetical protein